ncbi:MAG: membrane protein insertion efficiency factor YidD [Clostridia bacterium]|nr:membrane protein insertion efficiency factor YidD [Clostridia bacterium]
MRYLKKKAVKPYLKIVCMRLILFYQRRISRHTCMFRPTCSQYTLECINNHGAMIGIILGFFRILRCHPWAKEGKYDPAPEYYFKKKWLL